MRIRNGPHDAICGPRTLTTAIFVADARWNSRAQPPTVTIVAATGAASAGGGDLVHVRRPSRFSGAEAGPPASTPRVCESMPKGGWHNIGDGRLTNGPRVRPSYFFKKRAAAKTTTTCFFFEHAEAPRTQLLYFFDGLTTLAAAGGCEY